MENKSQHNAEDLTPYIIGFNIGQLRRRARITKSAFCTMVGIGRPTLDRLEDGESDPRIGLLTKVAAALDVSLSDLLNAPPQEIDVRTVLSRRKRERNERNLAKSPASRPRRANPPIANLRGADASSQAPLPNELDQPSFDNI